jgi:glycosyltransferase involved in cell wall biosynthesis
MISICIPAYNYINYLPQTIESCLSQDEDFELVILDDFSLFNFKEFSIDDIKNLREKYSRDPRVKWYVNDFTLPIQANWNKTISLSSRPYVKLMGADDRLQSGSISRLYEMIRMCPEVDFHGHLARVVDADGSEVRKQNQYTTGSSPVKISGVSALKGKLRQEVRFKEPVCNLFKRSAFEKVGGYSDKYRFCFDIYFNTQIMAICECALWNDCLVDLRRHSDSDGAKLPAMLALSDLQGIVSEILFTLDKEAIFSDEVAADGWLLYRLIELTAKKITSNPKETLKMVYENPSIILKGPLVYKQAFKLVISRLLRGDIQQLL